MTEILLGPRAVISSTGLELPADLTSDEWREIGTRLGRAERSLMWAIGDWWAFGEHRYGDRKAIVSSPEWEGPGYQTCKDAACVARQFEKSRRRDLVDFTHHREVAPLPVEQQDRLLDAVEREDLSKAELRTRVKQIANARTIGAEVPSHETCTAEDLSVLQKSGGRFGTIYADPPWLYDNQGTRAATSNHYGGMTVAEICALPISELAAEAAHLHLWTTNAFLFECPKIFAAWGFEFKSSFAWVKPEMGIGNYWRNSHEIMLTAVRGDATRFNDHSLKSWLECSRGAHSAKPEQLRRMIERASPGPYLELFGRSPATGWTVWGNQIERGLLHQDARKCA